MDAKRLSEIRSDLINKGDAFMKALEGYHTELAKIREERVPTAEERHCFKEISRVLYAVRGMSFDFVEKEGKPQIELISSK